MSLQNLNLSQLQHDILGFLSLSSHEFSPPENGIIISQKVDHFGGGVPNRRNALFASHDEGGRNWAHFASLIGTCKMSGVEQYAYLRDLFTKLANGHLARDIDALMPWAYTQQGDGA